MLIFYQVSEHQTIPCALPAGEVAEERCQGTKGSDPPYLQVEPVKRNDINYFSTRYFSLLKRIRVLFAVRQLLKLLHILVVTLWDKSIC
jgi:hypothetical protein